ncbi:MAG: methyltransferase domain-containing protein [Acidobacteria bacterium]|nr:methyltransferase domain-containing protein [Acidobacteriota bacterium]
MTFTDRVHGGYVHRRRVAVLADELSRLIAPGSSVLDVGSGDGWLASRVRDAARADVRGIDTLVRASTHIAVEPFDGSRIPHADRSFDYVMLVDVLHHTDNPEVLLKEAARVARTAVLIKDHLLEGLWANSTLRFMDKVGNARHGVVLPFNYWPRARWEEAFRKLGLGATFWKIDLRLYPRIVNWAFGRSLHFIARLEPQRRVTG